MNTAARILGTHVRFFRDGEDFTDPEAGTAGRAARPGDADTGWIDLGIINENAVEPVGEEKEIWAPNPGRLELDDVLVTKVGLNFTLRCEEMSPLAFEALFGTAALTESSTDFSPLEGFPLKGWLEFKHYDQKNVLLSTTNVFVYLKVSGEVTFGEDVVRVPFQARLLRSTLNQGTIGS